MLETPTDILTTDYVSLQVDESMLSEECLDDEQLPPPPCALPPPPSYPGIPNPFVQMALPGGGIVSMPLDSSRVGSPDPSLGHDVLSVTAGEPVTHFNLDQLLEIVQSFQLDTTHAHDSGQEKSQSHKKVCLAGIAAHHSLTSVGNIPCT